MAAAAAAEPMPKRTFCSTSPISVYFLIAVFNFSIVCPCLNGPAMKSFAGHSSIGRPHARFDVSGEARLAPGVLLGHADATLGFAEAAAWLTAVKRVGNRPAPPRLPRA